MRTLPQQKLTVEVTRYDENLGPPATVHINVTARTIAEACKQAIHDAHYVLHSTSWGPRRYKAGAVYPAGMPWPK